MPENEVVSAPPAEGGEPQNGSSQVAEPGAQVPAQSQEAGSIRVENGQQLTSSPTNERPRGASEWFKNRKELSSLKQQLASMQEKQNFLQQGLNKPASSEPPKVLTDQELETLYWSDPGKHWVELKKGLQEFKDLKNSIDERFKEFEEKKLPDTISGYERQKEFRKQEQEALELIFPKGNSSKSLEIRIQENQDRAKKAGEIADEYGLSWAKNPIKVAQFIIKELGFSNGSVATVQNPNAPKKSQMVMTATGSGPSNGGNAKVNKTFSELKAEKERLSSLADENPDLRYDDKFKAEFKAVLDGFTSLLKENKS